MLFAVPPPEFKVARWTLAKLKKVMAKERPSGRKIRPGLDVEATDSICKVLFDCLGRPPYKSTPVTRMYVNIGAAIAFTFEKALRAGETCPGEAFDPKDHLSRQTIGAVLQPAASLQTGDVQAVVIQPPLRKTSFASEAARQKASAPLVFDANRPGPAVRMAADSSFPVGRQIQRGLVRRQSPRRTTQGGTGRDPQLGRF